VNVDGFDSILRDLQDLVPLTCACGAEFRIPRKFAKGSPGRCDACTRAREGAQQARERRARLESRVPEMYRWCSFEALAELDPAERARRVKDPTGIARALAASEDAKRIVISGPAGAGKTVLAHCIFRRWGERHPDHPGVFVDGYELATARARVRLGDEAPVVTNALRASALLIDDLMAKPGNPAHDATSDVIFERHQRMRSTIITCGFSKDEVRARLGDGIARRVYENACHIDLKPPKR
jgi:DNA replication protein DnaC